MSLNWTSLASSVGRSVRAWIWWVRGILLIAVALGLCSCLKSTTPPPPPPVVNTAGFDPIIAVAIQQARSAAVNAPDSAEARGRLGMVLLAHDIRALAEESFAQAIVLATREPKWFYLCGLAQLPDNPAAAATNFDRAVRMFPKDQVLPRLTLADTLLMAGRMDEAEAQYRLVLQRDPNSARARLGLGKLSNARGQTAEAAEFLAGAIQDASTRKAAHRLLLNVYQRLGRTNEAERLARVLATLAPDEPLADPYLAKVQQLKTGQAAWIDLGEEWIKVGRLADAAALLEKTVQTYTNSDRAMFLLGRARLRLGDSAGAEAILLRSTQLAPGSVEALVQLGVVQLSRGHTKDAQRSFRAAVQAKPNVAEAWFNLGLSLGNDSRGESVAAFREAIRLKPSLAEAYLALAVVLRAEGQNQAAADELRHALNLYPEEALRQKLLAQLKLCETP